MICIFPENKPIIVYKKRIEELFFTLNYPIIVIYATGAAINTAVKLFIYSKKWLGWTSESKVLTYSVPASYTKQILKKASIEPIEEDCK